MQTLADAALYIVGVDWQGMHEAAPLPLYLPDSQATQLAPEINVPAGQLSRQEDRSADVKVPLAQATQAVPTTCEPAGHTLKH